MAAKDMGTKFTCFKCAAKFYDMKKPEPICPKCGADQRESPALRPSDKSERKRAAKAAVVEEPALEEEAAEAEDAAEDEDDAAEEPAAADDEEDF
jgi:uncharacterized protein (TIGR02300 family)